MAAGTRRATQTACVLQSVEGDLFLSLCRSSIGEGKPHSKKAGKAQSLQQQQSEDMDLEELTGRSNTATPGRSEDDMHSK